MHKFTATLFIAAGKLNFIFWSFYSSIKYILEKAKTKNLPAFRKEVLLK